MAPNARFALYFQPDPWAAAPDAAKLLPHTAVDTLPEQAHTIYRFVGIKAGDRVPALAVLASASDEPDYGPHICESNVQIESCNLTQHASAA